MEGWVEREGACEGAHMPQNSLTQSELKIQYRIIYDNHTGKTIATVIQYLESRL
jgi:hypothetical protein